jgi:hypothetical protein
MDQLSVHAGATETLLPDDFRWPGGKRLAVFFRCAFEGWSDGHWPGVGPMGNPLKAGVPDLNAIGFAEYGHRRGIFRVLDTLAREGINATMIVSGIMAERHPEIVRKIADAGHDIVAHSYAMDVIPIYLDEDQERSNIRRTVDLIVRATGRRPTGWISPRGTPSPHTGRLLAEEGFEWHGDSLNDDLPYLCTSRPAPWSRSPATWSAMTCRSICATATRRGSCWRSFRIGSTTSATTKRAPPASTRRSIPTCSAVRSAWRYSSA